MPEFTVCRTFAMRKRWKVQAPNRDAAEAMFENDRLTPWELGDEEWLGPVVPYRRQELLDNVLDAEGNEV
jgi:hypothetical protein